MSKALSLKLDDDTFRDTEKVRKRLQRPRNAYIKDALRHYNRLQFRAALAKSYARASRALGAANLADLRETDTIEDLPG